uniref:NR LBD domain-containing protein n=1 Tax=Myotis myotis TaxID=51298 RepID=A0A7J7WVI0_MYOMY|nr:hypothetical protein mMyoMyo1_011864 [Myotis myotis]
MAADRAVAFMDPVCAFQEQVDKLGCLQVDSAEYGCLQAMALFTPDACGRQIQRTWGASRRRHRWPSLCTAGPVPVPSPALRAPAAVAPALRAVPASLTSQLFFMRLVGKAPMETLIRDMLLSGSPFHWPCGSGQ